MDLVEHFRIDSSSQQCFHDVEGNGIAAIAGHGSIPNNWSGQDNYNF